jgi:hypothetical protein
MGSLEPQQSSAWSVIRTRIWNISSSTTCSVLFPLTPGYRLPETRREATGFGVVLPFVAGQFFPSASRATAVWGWLAVFTDLGLGLLATFLCLLAASFLDCFVAALFVVLTV